MTEREQFDIVKGAVSDVVQNSRNKLGLFLFNFKKKLSAYNFIPPIYMCIYIGDIYIYIYII